jgi:hypothetical protein
LIPKVPDLLLLLVGLILKLSVMLPWPQKFSPQFTQGPAKQFVQHAPIQLLKCAQAAQIFVAQSNHVQCSHDL